MGQVMLGFLESYPKIPSACCWAVLGWRAMQRGVCVGSGGTQSLLGAGFVSWVDRRAVSWGKEFGLIRGGDTSLCKL